jgi:predicted Rossmann-fold nucleotide-binding protein
LPVQSGRIAVHGGSIGSDEQFHHLAVDLKWSVVIYPSTITEKRAPSLGVTAATVCAPEMSAKRNRKMVESSEYLIAAPRGYKEVERSEVWTMIRYAQSLGKPVLIVYRNGTSEWRR